MPGHRTPAATPLGGSISRRRAELLLQSGVGGRGGVLPVKDLRLRRVVPPASASLESSPECVAAASSKPGSVASTPPEVASADELERKPVLPRSKLVRDLGSFGYRRLLPFLNQMVKNDGSDGKGMPSENTTTNSAKELNRSHLGFIDKSASGGCRESDPVESVEPLVVKTGCDTEVKDSCNNVREETNTVPLDLASSKPCLTRCTRSRFVHHPSSFSYKRMLPFLMENEISSQEGESVKIRRITGERQLTSDENDISGSGQHHLAASEDSSMECNRVQNERMEEEKPSEETGNYVLDGKLLEPAVPKASPPECSAAEVQNVTEQEALTSNQDPLISYEGESTSDGDDILANGQHQLAVSEDSPEECNRDEVKIRVQDKEDGDCVLDGRKLQPAVSELSALEDSTALVQKVAQEQPLTSDGVEENSLTSYKGELLAKEQLQPYVTKETTAQQQDSAEFTEVPQQCQSSESGCPDVGFGSPTKTTKSLLHQHCALQRQNVVASLDNDPLQLICRPSDPCAIDRSLSVEGMPGCVPLTESGSSKAGILRPRAAHSMEKRGLSPKKLSPRKGILKKHTRGCKGICMCLDCSTFRLRADRAFEFSKKQMQEADDIIVNLLKEVANLRSLVEKSADQRESTQEACRRASQVEEVARDRCQQMFLDLNSHCRIPGPRVRFAQYVDKTTAPSPRTRNRR